MVNFSKNAKAGIHYKTPDGVNSHNDIDGRRLSNHKLTEGRGLFFWLDRESCNSS